MSGEKGLKSFLKKSFRHVDRQEFSDKLNAYEMLLKREKKEDAERVRWLKKLFE